MWGAVESRERSETRRSVSSTQVLANKRLLSDMLYSCNSHMDWCICPGAASAASAASAAAATYRTAPEPGRTGRQRSPRWRGPRRQSAAALTAGQCGKRLKRGVQRGPCALWPIQPASEAGCRASPLHRPEKAVTTRVEGFNIVHELLQALASATAGGTTMCPLISRAAPPAWLHCKRSSQLPINSQTCPEMRRRAQAAQELALSASRHAGTPPPALATGCAACATCRSAPSNIQHGVSPSCAKQSAQ